MADVQIDDTDGVTGENGALSSDDRSVVATFCFVDIAGYTALTDCHGERAAADLVDEFVRLVHAAVESRGKVQELSGDNAFLVFPDPAFAMLALDALYASIAKLPEFPLLRSGLHHGPSLFRMNRYFGSTINIAARASAHAEAGEIVCTAAAAQMLAAQNSTLFSIHPLGSFKLKNLPRRYELHRITLAQIARAIAIDPVCLMQVDTHLATADAWFDRKQYFFCSAKCSHRFSMAPSEFL